MITRILMSVMAYFVMQVAGCEYLQGTNPPDEPGRCEYIHNREGHEFFSNSFVFNEPNGIPVAQLLPGYSYVFEPTEYAIVGDSKWIKVWVRPYPSYLETWVEGIPPEGASVWLQVVNDYATSVTDHISDACLELLTYTDTTEPAGSLDIAPENGLGCTYRPDEGFDRFPARVGPGFSRAIFRYLSSEEVGETLYITGTVPLHPIERAYLEEHSPKIYYAWYRFAYNGDHLWVSQYDLGLYDRGSILRYLEPDACLLPEIAPPPVAVSPAPVVSTVYQDFEVYHCRHLGSNQFEWYSARVTYDGNGNALSEEITGGPYTGEWRAGCPAGEILSEPRLGEPPPQINTPLPTDTLIPTDTPPPPATATPTPTRPS